MSRPGPTCTWRCGGAASSCTTPAPPQASTPRRSLAAFRALNSGLRRHGDAAPPLAQATALAQLIELATVLDEPERVPAWGERLQRLTLTAGERREVEAAVTDPALLAPWLPAGHRPRG